MAILSEIGDIAGDYFKYKYGSRILGGGSPPPQPISATPAFLDMPMVDVIPEPQTSRGMVYDPNANCGAGKWIRRRTRKRKRLATKTDLKDLAALKGILGQGKAFEVWIATHG